MQALGLDVGSGTTCRTCGGLFGVEAFGMVFSVLCQKQTVEAKCELGKPLVMLLVVISLEECLCFLFTSLRYRYGTCSGLFGVEAFGMAFAVLCQKHIIEVKCELGKAL